MCRLERKHSSGCSRCLPYQAVHLQCRYQHAICKLLNTTAVTADTVVHRLKHEGMLWDGHAYDTPNFATSTIQLCMMSILFCIEVKLKMTKMMVKMRHTAVLQVCCYLDQQSQQHSHHCNNTLQQLLLYMCNWVEALSLHSNQISNDSLQKSATYYCMCCKKGNFEMLHHIGRGRTTGMRQST